jgi:hypothetical protein
MKFNGKALIGGLLLLAVAASSQNGGRNGPVFEPGGDR